MTISEGYDVAAETIVFLQRTLTAHAQAMAGLVSALGAASASLGGAPALQQALSASYQSLFLTATPPSPVQGAAAHAGAPAEDFARFQSAASRWAVVLAGIAADAGRRLAAALAETGPAAPPITRLAELQDLWIDCGEAAWGAAAAGDEFALAQAELLMAYAELRAGRS